MSYIYIHTILPKVLAPLLMKGLTTLVISMSTNLKALPNWGNKEMNVLKNGISTSVASVLKCMKGRYPYVQVTGVR